MTEIRRETQMDKILRTTEASAKLNRTSESNFTVWKKKKSLENGGNYTHMGRPLAMFF